MLNSIVGPAVKGVADFASPQKDKKSSGSDSFGKVLEEKSFSKAPKDKDDLGPNRAADSPKQVQEKRLSRESERKKPDTEKATAKTERKEEADRTESKVVKGKSQREQAISKFMDSFESEFGVPPTRIVEAMAALKQSELNQSPEQTADQVIDQLGLEEKDKDLAKGMYIGLLAQLGKMDQTPAMPKPELSFFASGSQGRFEDVQGQKLALNDSLQAMNEKFWMNGSVGVNAQLASGPADENALSQGLGASFADGSIGGMSLQEQIQANPNFKIDPSKLNPEMQQALQAVKEANPTASPEVALAALVAAARAQKAKAAGEGQMTSEEAELAAAVEAAKGGAASKTAMNHAEAGFGVQSAHAEGLQVTPDPNAQRHSASQFSQQGSQQESSLGAKTTQGEVASKDKAAKTSEFESMLRMDGLNAPAPLKDLGLPAAGVATTGAAGSVGKTEDQADIKQIMNQAQYLIKKGGGEMKVEMTPEGMGKIQMKVLVENGKVNVQMSAETNEAKKVLEGGLSDLKNSLAAHNLSMDHIKVDVVNHTNTDNTAQNQMNQNPGSREQTRQFWNHFSENFGSGSQQRENFTDIPSLRGYARPRTDQPLEPVRSARVANYGATGKGKGLNLVA